MSTQRNSTDQVAWLEKANTLHRQVEMLYVVDGYQVQVTWDCAPISEAFHGETLPDAISKAMAGFDLDAPPKWLNCRTIEPQEIQMATLLQQRNALLEALNAAITGWERGNDVCGPMAAGRQVLNKFAAELAAIATTKEPPEGGSL